MASGKRKAITDERPNKKAKASDKSDKPFAKATSRPSASDLTERRPLPKSILQQEDRAFPRGGGSVLTPIEQKQIKAQAEQDVLFEQETGKLVDGQDGEELFKDETVAGASGKRKAKKQKPSKEDTKPSDVPALKVHGLSYKNLSIGTTVLGYVSAITSRDVELAFANNLSGYIPITAVSDRLNARIAKLLDEDEREEQDEDEEDIDLKKLFHVGQWLRATIVATTAEAGDGAAKSKRHIQLTVEPQQVNAGLTTENIVVNSMIQAAVNSVEDHGIVMDLGLTQTGSRGFISKKDLGSMYDIDKIKDGQVLLCLVTSKGSSGNVLNLYPGAVPRSALAEGKQAPTVSEAPTVEGFQAGTAVDILVTDTAASGVAGKIMGSLEITADLVHCGSKPGEEITKKYKIGSKVKGRITWTIPNDDGSRRIGVSLLDHLLTLPPSLSKLPSNASAKLKAQSTSLEQHQPLSSIVDNAKVVHVVSNRGLYMQLPMGGSKLTLNAFAHISQISDDRIDALTSAMGRFKVDSTHRARILAYNPVDNLYYVSLKPSVLEQKFLRIEDLTVGGIVKANVERLILGAQGVTGIIVKLSDNITALVPEIHLSDVRLEHPERKFKEGFPVKARVLSVDLDKRRVRLTLKKTLVNDDATALLWKNYDELKPGMESKGTIVNVMRSGAAVQFYGEVRAWLPVAEMSDTFIEDPEKHFRLGQSVNVRIVSVDAETQQMKVSCKESRAFDDDSQEAWDKIQGGELVSGTVTENSPEAVTVQLDNGLKGSIRVGHLSDNATSDPQKALKKIHVGRTLADLVVLHKLERSRHVLLSRKATIVEDAKASGLVSSFSAVAVGRKIHGFVRNVTPEGVYVEFVAGVVGLLPKSQLTSDMMGRAAFGLVKDQSLSAWVMTVDPVRERFTLSMREQADEKPGQTTSIPALAIHNPVDPSITSSADLTIGRITKVRVTAIKASQLNVRLADKIPGRIDVSETFDSWDAIMNKKAPLQRFKANDVIDVKILGMHDARTHRFLPITHRQMGEPVFELSAKTSRIESANEAGLTMDSVKVGEQHLAFVNNYGDNCVWVNVSPNVRGRIALMDLSDDAGQLQNLSKNFPVGCALRVTVKAVDANMNRLDLVARVVDSAEEVTLQTVSEGMLLTARVTKVTDRAVMVQLSENLSAPVPLVEIDDDYDNINLDKYSKNDIVRVCVVEVDLPNKKLYLTMRPSRVLSSSLPVKDAQISSYRQLKAKDLIRGYVKHVAEKGVYVSLGANVDAFVRISDLSDKFVKEWKNIIQVDQLVKARILSVDSDAKHALLSLKESVVDAGYTPPLTIQDLEAGMIVTGKVRKVEDFGAFIDLDNTQPRLSGLCHRSEVAAKRVEDVRKIYSPGDVVKTKILTVDVESRKISLGLKASYFVDADVDEEMEDEDDSGVEVDDGLEDEADEDGDVDMAGGIELDAVQNMESDDEDVISNSDEGDEEVSTPRTTSALKTSGFDWSGTGMDDNAVAGASDSETDVAAPKKRKRKAEIKTDLTGDLDKYGARSVSDFERQLLGQPNDSGLWIQYMAFQLELSEVQRAREIAARAIRTIHIREIEEKTNIWIAYLNLEVEYGDEDRVEEVFKEACQVQDPLEMHEKLASIYIDSGRHEKADAIFERVVANKAFRASPAIWYNYADFLMSTLKAADRARALLPRALQSIPVNEHRALTARFAALEFRSANGNTERGRTIFEGLIAEYPKWSSGWDMFVDLERSRLAHANSQEAKKGAKEKVRALYERMVGGKMKKRRAKFVLKRWLEFEEKEGDARSVERVNAIAREVVERMKAVAEDGDT